MGTCLATQGNDIYENIQFPPWTEKGGPPRKNRDKLMDILRHPYLTILFREFLRLNLALESYLFFVEVELYRELAEDRDRQQIAQDIFQKYFGPNSEYEIHVDGNIIEGLKAEITQDPISSTIFDFVQQTVLLTLEGTCLPNFLVWKLYVEFLIDPITRKVFLNTVNGYPPCETSNQYIRRLQEKILLARAKDEAHINSSPSSPVLMGNIDQKSKSTSNVRTRKLSVTTSVNNQPLPQSNASVNNNNNNNNTANNNFGFGYYNKTKSTTNETESWKPSFLGAGYTRTEYSTPQPDLSHTLPQSSSLHRVIDFSDVLPVARETMVETQPN
eukprot:TRINITY_DN18921_c0_g1_i1.p1 TRINITY_DN18921_c0_g1~~TRINITY_DN18921_c0_g1_i1.p1  ORF type:complete len:329 (-),score=47.96 TRINITY_DN18921_c0_g1_i1:179-1165(-)